MRDSFEGEYKFYEDIETTQADTNCEKIVRQIESMFKMDLIQLIINAYQSLIAKNKFTVDQDEVIKHYHSHYLKNYWTIYKTLIFYVILISWILVLMFAEEYNRTLEFAICYAPINLSIITFIDYVAKNNTENLSYFILGTSIMHSIDFSIFTIIENEFKMCPLWSVYYIVMFAISIVHCLDSKQVIKSFFISKTIYFTLVHIRFGVMDSLFYSGEITIFILFPAVGVALSNMMKNLLFALKENKELVTTIENMLQVLPESVLIQCPDSQNNMIIKYANDRAVQNLLDESCQNGMESKMNFKNFDIKIMKESQSFKFLNTILKDESVDVSDTTLPEFIAYHEKLVQNGSTEVLSTIEIIDRSTKFLNKSSYSVKSIKVKWNHLKNAYMHMFIDTGDIKKLEKQKAINKGQHIMLSSVSHEFRTPINAFSNSLELLRHNFEKLHFITKNSININDMKKYEILVENITKYLKIGRVSSKILTNLVEDILDLAKLEAGTFSTNMSPFVLNSLIEDLQDIFSFQGKQKNLELKFTLDGGLENLSFGSDLGRIKQILMNLISNAFKFTNKGGIYVTIRLEHRVAPNLVFQVSDTGVGMSKSEMKNLFTMFSALDRHRQSLNIRGTGLGLTISKKLTEMLGGTIKVESKENIGTTFTFDIKQGVPPHSGAQEEMVNNEDQNANYLFENDFSNLLSGSSERISSLRSIICHSSKLLRKVRNS